MLVWLKILLGYILFLFWVVPITQLFSFAYPKSQCEVMLHLSWRAIRMLVGNLPSFWAVLNWVFTYATISSLVFRPSFRDLLESSPLNNIFQKSICLPIMPVLDLDVWNPVFSSKVRKASVAYWVSLLGQRRGQICAAWGAQECATSSQGWAAPEMPTEPRACHQKLL